MVGRKKTILKIRAEVSDTETVKTIGKNSDTNSCFWKDIQKHDKPLARLT